MRNFPRYVQFVSTKDSQYPSQALAHDSDISTSSSISCSFESETLPAVVFANRCLVKSYEHRHRAAERPRSSNLPIPSSPVSASVSFDSVASAAALHESLSCASTAVSSSKVRYQESFETARQWGDELLDNVSESSSLATLKVMKINLYRKRLYYMKLNTIRKQEKSQSSKYVIDKIRDTAKRQKRDDRPCKDTSLNNTLKHEGNEEKRAKSVHMIQDTAKRRKRDDRPCKDTSLNNTLKHEGNEKKGGQRPRKYRTSKWIQDTIKWRAERQRKLQDNNVVNR